MPERESVYGHLTGYDFVLLSARLHGLADPHEAARSAVAEVDLGAAATRATGGYSKGMKQRIKVAAALVHDPSVLLLDEPFNGADPRQRLHMIELFRRLAAEGRTIVFSSHILEEVERLAERVLVIVSGRLAASGDFREIRRLMTDAPHTFVLRTSDNRRLAAALVAHESVVGVELGSEHADRADFAARRVRARRARDRARRVRLDPRAQADGRVPGGCLLLPGEPVTGIIFRLTLRQMLGRGRTILIGLLALLPVLDRARLPAREPGHRPAGMGGDRPPRRPRRLDAPAARGARLRDGRARRRDRGRDGRLPPLEAHHPEPDHRRQAAGELGADDGDRPLVSASSAGAIALYDQPKGDILLGFGVGIVLGGLVYSALFVLLSIVTSRALIAGLIYVFIWEGLVNGFFAGTRLLSVRHYTLGSPTRSSTCPRRTSTPRSARRRRSS